MKTKLILIAVITIIGISLFSAFKQSEAAKNYLTFSVGPQLIVVDENNKIESIVKAEQEYGKLLQQINLEMNNISRRGFKLVNSSQLYTTNIIYTFEK